MWVPQTSPQLCKPRFVSFTPTAPTCPHTKQSDSGRLLSFSPWMVVCSQRPAPRTYSCDTGLPSCLWLEKVNPQELRAPHLKSEGLAMLGPGPDASSPPRSFLSSRTRLLHLPQPMLEPLPVSRAHFRQGEGSEWRIYPSSWREEFPARHTTRNVGSQRLPEGCPPLAVLFPASLVTHI